MKKITCIKVICAIVAIVMLSCEKEEHFDETLLYGKWQSGTLYYRYFGDGTGYTWDTADDVYEDEAQNFTWTLVKAELTHMHIMEIGGVVPRVYTVTELTTSSLRYKDDFGRTYNFTRVED